ncbi:hypothetical protein BP5796_11888 [Coleophoma crateriformis]|uniref:TAFII55 protein conserved region domain-containing protein n=1 Tax=Coleophoma crateriformis TaxID=565419 RepID=A0A3D8QEL0_9HELO|nr:hypothetical protein BP5796_11888 [Coleophoma crateriformis]
MAGIKLKLNIGGGGGNSTSISTPATATAATPGPLPTLGAATPQSSKPKIKFKSASKSVPPTPAVETVPVVDAAPKKTKAGRAPKPSAKLVEANRKRTKEESDSEDELSTIKVQERLPPSKKIKLSLGGVGSAAAHRTTPTVLGMPKIKAKGKPVPRKKGEGYDSEASDREQDPTIEEEFILRMIPGEDCDYLRQAIADKKIGVPKKDGGADVYFRFYDQELRRGTITIRGRHYAATLVDLPTIIEGMKSWDKRGWWKTADICQMLLVFAPIAREEEAKTIPLPKTINPTTYQYPHGLTPPMHYAQKRRFRKRISRTAIEAVEDAVNQLMAADEDAIETKFDIIDPDAGSRAGHSPGSSPDPFGDGEYSEDEDAEGEADDGGYFSHMNGHNTIDAPADDMDLDLEADLEAAMVEQALESATPMSSGIVDTPTNGDTPMPGDTSGHEEPAEDSFESGDDDDDDDDGEDDEIDEDEKARIAKLQTDREDIADLEKQFAEVQKSLATQQNQILRKRLEDQVRRIKAELQLKKSAMPAGEYEDE